MWRSSTFEGIVTILVILSSSFFQLNAETKSCSAKTSGQRYEALVPDTLDLAKRAEYALNTLTRTPEAKRGYNGYQCYYLYANPIFLGCPEGCMSKYMEAIPLMRIMCGSDLNAGIEGKMLELSSLI